MSTPNSRELSKVAKLCRKLGISHFKCEDYEFTLSDREPTRRVSIKKPLVTKTDFQDFQEAMEKFEDEIPGDMPSGDDLLFWSSGPTNEDEAKAES